MGKVTILGAGAWGTAIAITLARGGRAVTLAVRRTAMVAEIRARGENAIHLPGIKFPPSVAVTHDWIDAVRDAETVVMAVPSRFARAAIEPIAGAIPPQATIISVTKGIETDTLMTMTAMLRQLTATPSASVDRIAVVSGPSFAAEVAAGKPAAVVAAASNEALAARAQALFAVRPLRVYHSDDVIGVELGGAVKNVIAIAAGIGDGLELGSSARAALITRGLAEMMRLAAAAGGRRETMAGLAGLGDLVLTCTGELSRNRALGFKIGRGEPLPATADGSPVAEGMANAAAIRALAARMGVEMPIVTAVCRVLYEAAPAKAMVEELMSRQLKAEF